MACVRLCAVLDVPNTCKLNNNHQVHIYLGLCRQISDFHPSKNFSRTALEEDEVYSVARVLGDLVAYRASGTGHLELLTGF